MTEYEYLTRFEMNENWLNTRYRRNKKKHITPALETKETRGIARNNLEEETLIYHRLDSDTRRGYTSYYAMKSLTRTKKNKKRHY